MLCFFFFFQLAITSAQQLPSFATFAWSYLNYLKSKSSMFFTMYLFLKICFPSVSSVQFSPSVVFNSLRPYESQHTRPPCPSPTPRIYPNPCPSSQWCHPAISSSVVPFSSCPQSFPASGSFPMSQLFAWGGQSTGVSASAYLTTILSTHLIPSPLSISLKVPLGLS